ncbi:ShlB/FhaC/HecB family hemolysin secretion/activation protein [Dongshaea marina]|uniref:ShlB/FhaC/HecB family hemolysin secretion/activation protein n=1 Tax=Dongshaea marina TaxID=2047966 RepID=UPI00131EE376|nr:ShlB/FhaC/HecB family hemolysin secretion/activation protein [Dongshaea marina]
MSRDRIELRSRQDLLGVFLIFVLVTISIFFSSNLIAAPNSNVRPKVDAGSLLRQQELQEKAQQQRLPELEEKKQKKPVEKVKEGPKVLIREIKFSGDHQLLPVTEQEKLTRDLIGKRVGINELLQSVDQTTDHLRSKGYLVARAYLPRQDVSEGVVTIAIIGGRLDGSAEKGGGWIMKAAPDEKPRASLEFLRQMAEAAAPSGSMVQQQNLERGLLLINDLPAIHTESHLEPGLQPGSTRLVVDVYEDPLFSGRLWGDNYGSRSTGEAQLNTLLSLNDLTGRGDRVQLLLTGSEGLKLGRLEYQRPLGVSGLRGGLSYVYLDYKAVEGTAETSGLKGDSQVMQAELSYPLLRSRPLNLSSYLRYNHKKMLDDSSAGRVRDKRVDSAMLGIGGDRSDGWLTGGITLWDLNLVTGYLDLSRVPQDEQTDAQSLDTQGHYWKLGYSLARLQRLPGTWSLYGRLSGQYAGKNLDSSEEFILGGPNGVQAYPINEGSGDQGWLAHLELRYAVAGGTPWGSLILSGFGNTGNITLHHDPPHPLVTHPAVIAISSVGWGSQPCCSRRICIS